MSESPRAPAPPTMAPLTFVVATLGELAALTLWRVYADAGRPALAVLALVVGFAVERGAVARWLRRVRHDDAPPAPLRVVVGLLVLVTVVEIAIWFGWHAAAARWNVEIAGLLFFAAIHALHAQEMGAVRRQPGLRYLLSRRTAFFSLMETLGATAWLALDWAGHPWWGRVALLVGLGVEHVVQGRALTAEGV